MMHTDLDVYNDSMRLVKLIYAVTNDFPREEVWGLTSQMKRAVTSIPINIAEGCGRKSRNELLNYLNISLSSLTELITQLEIAFMLGFIKDSQQSATINELALAVKRQLIGLIRSNSRDNK